MLVRTVSGSSGGGNTSKSYGVIIVNSVWHIICNGESVYNTGTGQGGFYKSINYTSDDGYIQVTKNASSYDFTITYNKACEECYINGATTTQTLQSAGYSRTCTLTSATVFAYFE